MPFIRLAFVNMKKNIRTFLPYFLACSLAIAVFFVLHAVSVQPELPDLSGGKSLTTILTLTVYIAALFSLVFIFYTNSFLIKQRKKELGLYSVLGMEKKHIMLIVFWETLFTAIGSLVLGIITGIVFSKLIFLLLINLLDIALLTTFAISASSVCLTILLFFGIFLTVFILNMIRVHLSNPIDLLKGGQVGEKEPKTKLLMAIVGVLSLAAGYIIALTVDKPLDAIPLFFLAACLVIFGTYATFTAGSIAFLKLLRKNKRYYYKANHFISVSGIMYRMKQNSIGLANICILSTAALICFSSVTALYVGSVDNIQKQFPYDCRIVSGNASPERVAVIDQAITDLSSQNSVTVKEKLSFRTYEISFRQDKSVFTREGEKSIMCFFVPLDDYNRLCETNKTLSENEILIFSTSGIYPYDTLTVDGFGIDPFQVKETLTDWIVKISTSDAAFNDSYYIVVDSVNTALSIANKIDPLLELKYLTNRTYVNFAGDESKVADTCLALYDTISSDNEETFVFAEGSASAYRLFMAVCGGMLFCGIFLGLLFLVSTFLIMYYKQISEGLEDVERFHVMRKVGLGDREIKSVIRNQMKTMFFIPLLASAVHVLFSFRAVTKILSLLALSNIPLFAICTIAAILIYAILYIVVYTLTSRSYYRLVR